GLRLVEQGGASILERRQTRVTRRRGEAGQHSYLLDSAAPGGLSRSWNAAFCVGPPLRRAGLDVAAVSNCGHLWRHSSQSAWPLGPAWKLQCEADGERPKLHSTAQCKDGPKGQDVVCGLCSATRDRNEML